jgi:pimeloyl-ACP methyl ester carboxylesterase
MRTLHAAITLALSAVLLGGCFSNSNSNGASNDPGPTNPSSGNNVPSTPAPAAFRAQFQPGQGVLPYPTDLFLNGSADGTINAPVLSVTPNVSFVNMIDGFSTTSPVTATFSAPVDAATLSAAGAVTVIEATMATIATPTSIARVPIGVRRVLTRGVDYSVGLSTAVDGLNQVVQITPLRPFTPSTGGRATTLPAGAPAGTVDVGGVGYVVLLTNAIRSTGGTAAAPDTDYAQLRSVILGTSGTPNPANCAAITDATSNGLCQQIAPHLALGAAVGGVNPANVVLSFSFTTLATRDTLVQMATAVNNLATPPALALQGLPRPGGGLLTTKNILDPAGTNPALTGSANVYAGTITLPYYLNTPADATASNPQPPLTGQFLSATPVSLLPGVNCTATPASCSRFVTRYNPIPAKTRDVTIPVLVTLPNVGTKPAAGWPVVVFVHGLGGNRSNMLAIAESYASAGFAVVAIDQPMHGITPTDSAAALRIPGVAERTFDVDYVNNTTRLPPGGDGPDPSGANFIQIPSPVTSRDNLRQSTIDHLTLVKALPAAIAAGQTAPLFNGTRIHLSGQSLGGIAGTNIASLPSAIVSAALSVPGGGINRLLLDSPTFGPGISSAVAAQLGNNTLLYNAFFRDSQTATDAGDPLNHIAAAVAAKPVLLHKVVGDTVVPNSATDRLIVAGNLAKATGAGTWPSDSYVTFTQGSHGSLLAPGTTPAVTVEMQREFVGFAAAGGTGFQVTDASAVER